MEEIKCQTKFYLMEVILLLNIQKYAGQSIVKFFHRDFIVQEAPHKLIVGQLG